MQEQPFKRLVDIALDTRLTKSGTIQKKIKEIESENNTALSGKLPDRERTPTLEELAKFKDFAAAYKRQMPRASKREVRKAVQEHFGIRIYK